MHVTSHLAISGIEFTKSGWLDLSYARMIDGRTIQQHLELVEPKLKVIKSEFSLGPTFPWKQVKCDLEPYGLDYFSSLVQEVNLKQNYNIFGEENTTQYLIRLFRLFFIRWVEVESHLLNLRPEEIKSTVEVSNLFAASVQYELDRRSGRVELRQPEKLFPHGGDYLKLLENLAPCRLSQELCAYWFPNWSRAWFIFDSPFDYVTGPDQLARFLEENKC